MEKLAIPSAMVLCDESTCGALTVFPFPYENAREGQIQILPAIAQRGWLMDLDKHRCPGHARIILQAQNMIQVAKTMPGIIDVTPNGRKQ
jgi:hypothetical protein